MAAKSRARGTADRVRMAMAMISRAAGAVSHGVRQPTRARKSLRNRKIWWRRRESNPGRDRVSTRFGLTLWRILVWIQCGSTRAHVPRSDERAEPRKNKRSFWERDRAL